LPHDLLILGASTRAAAFSALRCGLIPRCADYFADRDLAAVCPVDRVDPRHARRQFIDLAEAVGRTPWLYTGGFENHPEWVDRISRRHLLWGVDGAALHLVRDPAHVADVLRQHEIPCPGVRTDSVGLPRDATWLKKPLASGGGRGIQPLVDRIDSAGKLHYFQERIDGPSFSALFVGQRWGAQFIGVTRQLIGIQDSPFVYRGSVGPMPVSAPLATRLRSLGDVLARSFGLIGWFGVDYILRDGIPWPVEINPRYTASVDIHEIASGRSLLAQHRIACEASSTTAEVPFPADFSPSCVIAKWILYAPRQLVAPEIIPEENESTNFLAVRSIADIPWPGTCIEPGEPVMTLMATAPDLAACRSHMAGLLQIWTKRLGIADEGDEASMIALSSHSWRSEDDDVLDL
jgi:uncharacterized protein